eukprot:10245979-Alexandrium_andersonii.AAC.1
MHFLASPCVSAHLCIMPRASVHLHIHASVCPWARGVRASARLSICASARRHFHASACPWVDESVIPRDRASAGFRIRMSARPR